MYGRFNARHSGESRSDGVVISYVIALDFQNERIGRMYGRNPENPRIS